MKDKALIVFIKNIQAGKVKTRLAATVGDEMAVKIYQALLERTQEAAQNVEAERFVFYSSFIEKNDGWKVADFTKKKQRGEGIGERMSNAFIDTLPMVKKVILCGGDIAGISAEILNGGLEKLEEFDFVLGPALDGGYYLIGMKEPEPAVFENIEWSTSTVAKRTLENIEQLGKTCYLLPYLSDIDYEEDWIEHGWEI